MHKMRDVTECVWTCMEKQYSIYVGTMYSAVFAAVMTLRAVYSFM